jgi:hypothetical protein
MSSAFDTVDHQVILDVLRRRFDVRDAALDWFQSYFSDRTQVVAIGSCLSCERNLTTGVPQGSAFGPRSYVAYSEDVVDNLVEHCTSHHLFADDIQGAAHNKPRSASLIVTALENCVNSVNRWCCSKRLQLNTRKTEVLWFGSHRNLEKLTPDAKNLNIGSDVIMPTKVVRDLGVYFDSEMNMKAHISKTSRACFYHLRRLRAVRNRLGQEIATRLVCAFVLSRLDYCNAVLAGLPASTLQPLQKVLNSAARLVLNLRPGEPTTAALRQLHWLPVRQRIEYKLCLLVHLSINGQAPDYLLELLESVADMPGRASLRSVGRCSLNVPRTRLKMGERAFSIAAPQAWNRLPLEIKLVKDTLSFKKQLKTFLFSAAFSS